MTKSERKKKKLLRRLEKYGIAATAVGVSFGALLEKSEADIVVFNGPIGEATSLYFDATSSATSTTPGQTIAQPYDFGFAWSGAAFINRRMTPVGSALNTVALAPGTVIDASTSFGNNYGPLTGSNVLFGFRVEGEPGVASPIFGWAEISVRNDQGSGGVTLERWAFENSGAGIRAGQVAIPEPTGLATLAMASGLAAIRRRRRRKAAETDPVTS